MHHHSYLLQIVRTYRLKEKMNEVIMNLVQHRILSKKTLLLLLVMSSLLWSACGDNQFVRVQANTFRLNNKEYRYIGTNYWYGGYLGTIDKDRLGMELDFLQKQNVTNLRVFICGEGDSSYAYRISPSLQPKPREYNEELLKGFDYLLNEASQRKMKIVFVLNNNWEWSGGFGQYLEWSGKENPPLPKTESWDWGDYCKYISQFYSCDSCLAWSNAWIQKVVTRTNSINGKKYSEDNAIMSWELSNEPRPMDSNAIEPYKNWVHHTAALIKSLDNNHLVTIGTEGVISTFYSEEIYSTIHNHKNIDYATLHLWPKTWVWYNGQSDASIVDSTLEKTKKYIEQHARLAKGFNKPLVIEEFGLHRDGNSFDPKVSTNNRNKYYDFVFKTGNENGVSGYNFWGFAGVPTNYNPKGFMQKGMPYSADPPQEEQGLYSVFKDDSSTWKTIRKFIKKH